MTGVHVEPNQALADAKAPPVPQGAVPTATHCDAELHDTPANDASAKNPPEPLTGWGAQ